MPSIKCRTCKIAKQSLMLEAVEQENEKAVLHVRYCALLAVMIAVKFIF